MAAELLLRATQTRQEQSVSLVSSGKQRLVDGAQTFNSCAPATIICVTADGIFIWTAIQTTRAQDPSAKQILLNAAFLHEVLSLFRYLEYGRLESSRQLLLSIQTQISWNGLLFSKKVLIQFLEIGTHANNICTNLTVCPL